ncbi:small multi-drug export protein [Cytobacillus purgationiresistens]|uniref:Membrane protein n=1 Tax=Cytobacillus purgationiresistens TaxID=863449 RepID=A0ABU0ARK4_9BACI|nr:small multi-drug export protein [Cytobacillus purgationiresistens]MDQ0273675.1 putative membrane protein [Cytobacillus purgationiresistens]
MLQDIQEVYMNLIPGLEENLFLQLLSIFILSLIPFFESYGAIPMGLILGFPSIPVILVAALGNWVSVMAFIWVISKLRSKVKRKKKDKEPTKRSIKARHYFEKYGVPGVSLAGILLAFHIAAGIALAAGANRSYVSLWMTISIALWSVVVGVLFMSGINLLS